MTLTVIQLPPPSSAVSPQQTGRSSTTKSPPLLLAEPRSSHTTLSVESLPQLPAPSSREETTSSLRELSHLLAPPLYRISQPRIPLRLKQQRQTSPSLPSHHHFSKPPVTERSSRQWQAQTTRILLPPEMG